MIQITHIGTWTFVQGEPSADLFNAILDYDLRRHPHAEFILSRRIAKEYGVTYAWGISGIRPPDKEEVLAAMRAG